MTFRNLEVTPNDPVSRWGFEGVLTAFERGDLPDWHRVFLAYRDDATGNVRAFVHEALDALEQGDTPGCWCPQTRQRAWACSRVMGRPPSA
jgi:hypothetical protein